MRAHSDFDGVKLYRISKFLWCVNWLVGPVKFELTNSHAHAYLMNLINTYVNLRIQVSKTVLKKGGSITMYRKLNTIIKKYITKVRLTPKPGIEPAL